MKDEVMIPQFNISGKQYEELKEYFDPEDLGFNKSMLAKMSITSAINTRKLNAFRRRQRLQARGEE